MSETASIVYRPCETSEILDTRDRTIILGTDRATPDFEGDDDPTTRHYGAFMDKTCVGCLSFFLNEWEGEPAWQLRGMGVEPEYRGQGIGAELLDSALADRSKNHPVRRYWCNARTEAVGFYLKRGWATASKEFLIDGVGPHFKMTFLPSERMCEEG